jgi:hypothetical protein
MKKLNGLQKNGLHPQNEVNLYTISIAPIVSSPFYPPYIKSERNASKENIYNNIILR